MDVLQPPCSVYACHDAATFVLIDDDSSGLAGQVLTDCLCAEHWLQLRLHDVERAYRYVPARYAVKKKPAMPTPCK